MLSTVSCASVAKPYNASFTPNKVRRGGIRGDSVAAVPSPRARRASRRNLHVVGVSSPPTAMAGTGNKEPSVEVVGLWANADAVAFDVDSTVCTDEGIDELAAFLGKGEEVAAWTNKAMGGGIPFGEALEARLSIMQPTAESVANFVANHPPKLSPGIAELVATLKANGKEVYLISGGFRHMIYPVADLLNIPHENVHANNILFNDADGSYAGYDDKEFTSSAGGKAEAVKHCKKAAGHGTMAMVGDGATDLEARVEGGAEVFVGYGGVQQRAAVVEGACWYVTSFQPLIDALK